MALVAGVVLLGRWLDVYLMVFPGVVGTSPTLGLWEIGLTVGGMGAFGLVLAGVLKGAYVLLQETAPLTHILLASGSEVQWAVAAARQLGAGTRKELDSVVFERVMGCADDDPCLRMEGPRQIGDAGSRHRTEQVNIDTGSR